MWAVSVTLALWVVAGSVWRAEAVQCYQCTSMGLNAYCSTESTCDVPNGLCFKRSLFDRASGRYYLQKGCQASGRVGCVQGSPNGNPSSECVCHTRYCNAAWHIQHTSLHSLLTVAAVTVLQRLFVYE